MYSEDECKDYMKEAIFEYEKNCLKGEIQKHKESHRHNIEFYRKKKNSRIVNGIKKQLRNYDKKQLRKNKDKIIFINLTEDDIQLLEQYAYILFNNVDIFQMKKDYDYFDIKSFNLKYLMYALIIKINNYRYEFKQYHIDIMPFIQIHEKTNMRFIKSSPKNKKRILKGAKQPQPIPKKPKISAIRNFLIGKHITPLIRGDQYPICINSSNLNKNYKIIKKINTYIKEKIGSYKYIIGSCKEIDKYIYYNQPNYTYLKGKTNEIKRFLKELKTNEEINKFDLITYSTYLKNS
jgi:hypothetical protein